VDSFTFHAELAEQRSNVGTVSVHVNEMKVVLTSVSLPPVVDPPSSSENSSSTSTSGALIGLLIVAFVLIGILTLAILVFLFFLYKKEGARKEMVKLFLGEHDATSGETTYYPQELNVAGDGDL